MNNCFKEHFIIKHIPRYFGICFIGINGTNAAYGYVIKRFFLIFRVNIFFKLLLSAKSLTFK